MLRCLLAPVLLLRRLLVRPKLRHLLRLPLSPGLRLLPLLQCPQQQLAHPCFLLCNHLPRRLLRRTCLGPLLLLPLPLSQPPLQLQHPSHHLLLQSHPLPRLHNLSRL